MSDLNMCLFTGRLTHKPELRHTPSSGTAVCNFTLANNQYGKGGAKKTIYIRGTIWNKPAEFTAGLDKGDHIMVQGVAVDDNYLVDKDDPDSMTKGRMKMDHCKLQLLRRKNQVEETPETPEPDDQ